MFGLSKTANRLLLGSIATLVLAAVLFLVIAVRFFSISRNNQSAGFEFGKGHEAQACVDEGVRRHTVTIDPTTQLGESTFVRTCLLAAKTDAEFCRGVPEFNFINQEPAAAWADSRCKEKGFTDGGCRYIYMAVITHCHMREQNKTRTNTNQ